MAPSFECCAFSASTRDRDGLQTLDVLHEVASVYLSVLNSGLALLYVPTTLRPDTPSETSLKNSPARDHGQEGSGFC
jgi:hypothetical protein